MIARLLNWLWHLRHGRAARLIEIIVRGGARGGAFLLHRNEGDRAPLLWASVGSRGIYRWIAPPDSALILLKRPFVSAPRGFRVRLIYDRRWGR